MKKTIDKIDVAKRALIGCMILVLINIGINLYFMLTLDYSSMLDEYKVDMGMDLVCMTLCFLLLYSCFQDDMTDRSNRDLARLITVLGLALSVNMLEGFCEMQEHFRAVTKIVVTFEYIFDDLIVIAFWCYIHTILKDKERYRKIHIFCLSIVACSIIASLLNYFFEYYFYIDQDGSLVELVACKYADFTGYLIYLIIFAIIVRSRISFREKLIILSFELLPFIGTVVFTAGQIYSFLYPSFLMSVVLIYINVYQKKKKKVAEQENLLTQQSMALMISQIQPHFLYNTLTTISNLCVKDPEQAEETTVMFSKYLRGNLDSLRKTEPVPFPMELDHIQIYVELEQRRFGDKLNVEYDIQDMNFKVPSLGLQPIVENSIKHGICKKTEPGHLLISTKKTKDGHVVIVEDDGVGFDPEGPAPDDGRSHVGVSNVRSRLERMCGAKMEITSSPGNGCRTVITFPD